LGPFRRGGMSRLWPLAVVVSLGLVLPFLAEPPCPAEPTSPERGPVRMTEEALRIHREALLIDGHNDLPWQFREKEDLSFQKIDLRRPQKKLHTDIPRLRQGGVGAQFWSAYVPVENRKKGTAVRMTLEQIDVIHRLAKTYPDTFEMAYSA